MLKQATSSWLRHHSRQLFFGTLTGGLWGFLTAAGATPRAWLTHDVGQGMVLIERGGIPPISVSADIFFQTYMTNLIQVTLTFLLLCLGAGWVAWQLSRIRPRGQPQPPLRTGWDTFVVAFLLGGLVTVILFQQFQLGEWVKGNPPTATVILTAVIAIVLPLLDGIGLFFIWFLRLKSVRAPDWETHYPPYRDWVRPLLGRAWRSIRSDRKGGEEVKQNRVP
jgi:hypothetical protein